MTAPNTGATPPAIVPIANNGPRESAVEAATRDALARIEQTGSAVPQSVNHGTGSQPRIPAGDPDGRGGRFSPDPIAEAGRNVPPADDPAAAPAAAAAPEAGQVDPAAPAAPAGEQQPPAAPAAPEGEQEPAGDEVPENVVTFTNEAGERIADDPALAAQLREVADLTLRGAEVEQALASLDEERAKILEQRALVQHNPVGFVLDTLAGQPQQLEQLVMYLIAHPDVQQHLGERINKVLRDPNERRATFAEMEARRTQAAATVTSVVQEERAVAENLREVRAAVTAMLPATLSPEARDVVYRDMLADIADYADRRDLLTVPVTDLPTLLAARLRVIGVDPTQAAQRVLEASTSSRRRVARFRGAGKPAAAAPARPAAPVPPVAPAPRTGRAFVEGQARRAAVGSMPGGGAGNPGVPGALEAPRNNDGSPMSVEQTIEWHRKRVATGQRVLGV
jgi:hypothetical protein